MLEGGQNPSVKAYMDFMIDTAVLFGANRTRAAEELAEVVMFEAALAQVVTLLAKNDNSALACGEILTFRFKSLAFTQRRPLTCLIRTYQISVGVNT